jgi:hypothetical protein
MKRRLALVLIVFALTASTAAGWMFSGNGHVIYRCVVAGGGDAGESPNGNVLDGTAAQGVAGRSSAPNGMVLVGGYQVAHPPTPLSARNWQSY